MDFIHIGIIDIIDIVLVALIMYYVYRMAKGTTAMNIITGIIIIFIIWVITKVLNMELLSSILGSVIGVGIIALIILFQPELRQFLQTLGQSQRRGGLMRKFFGTRKQETSDNSSIVKATLDMASTKTGALIVIQQESDLSLIVETGITVDAQISAPLLENLFFKNSPLHDGAVIVRDNRIVAARCVLPSTQQNVPKSYGMRHRAALGISDISDAIVIVVSEETGGISIAQRGVIRRNIPASIFQTVLAKHFRTSAEQKAEKYTPDTTKPLVPDIGKSKAVKEDHTSNEVHENAAAANTEKEGTAVAQNTENKEQ